MVNNSTREHKSHPKCLKFLFPTTMGVIISMVLSIRAISMAQTGNVDLPDRVIGIQIICIRRGGVGEASKKIQSTTLFDGRLIYKGNKCGGFSMTIQLILTREIHQICYMSIVCREKCQSGCWDLLNQWSHVKNLLFLIHAK